MSKADANGLESRVLVLAPVGRDAPLACAALAEHGLRAEACAGVEALCREVGRGAGAAFITREALANGGAEALSAALGAQPQWSDLPLIVLTRGGGAAETDTLAALGALGELGNVAFIERPAHIVTILSVVRSALRARLRQYELRDHLDALARAREERERLLQSEQAARLNAEINAALDAARPAAEAKGIELRSALDPAAAPVAGDADRLQQVVWNLVNNAVKFTPEGGRVEVRLSRAEAGVEIAVGDTGAGVEPEFLPFVFDRFRQADPTTTRTHGGLGLGLAIVRQLVELHGGTVAADSEGAGRGATFTVRLPHAAPLPHRTAPAPALATAAAAGPPEGAFDCELLSGLRVLVVDDERDARELFAQTLAECGAQVLTADSAADALDALERERPDVLLADIGMPGADGYELIARVRSLPPERGGRTPAAALTAYTRTEDRMRALRAGFQLHLPKPVKAAELVTVIASLAGRVGANHAK
ncbi:MAG: response regulator [Acidobacteria bacterium]|nr:response regulator [Acidobacteriota bacterium]